MTRAALAIAAVVLAAWASPLAARADCSKATRDALSGAVDAYGHWQSYSDSTTPAENGLAAPEWASFEREMDALIDDGDIAHCARSIQLQYYSFSASRDASRMTRLYALQGQYALHKAGMPNVPDQVLTNVVASALDVYYADLQTLYHLGYARKSPQEYAHFKRDVSGWFTTTGRSFASWENAAPPGSAPAPRGCDQPNGVAKVVNLVRPSFPEPTREIGLGKTTIGVTVLVGPAGNIVDARVTDTSYNAAADSVALAGALQSSYSAAMRDCQPVLGTVRANFVDQRG